MNGLHLKAGRRSLPGVCLMSASPVEVTLLISVVSGAVGVATRSLLLLVAGLTSIYATSADKRKAAATLTRLLMMVPWHRGRKITSEAARSARKNDASGG